MADVKVERTPESCEVLAEERRLQALERYDLLDTPREDTFDRIARLAKRIFRVQIATISLLDAHRQWFKSCEGYPGVEVPREASFCDRTIRQEQPLIIEDATKDARFAQNPFVIGALRIRFYAGAPLRSSDGLNVGTLCIADPEPRAFPAEDVALLWDLGRIVMDAFELRLVATKDSLTGALTRRAFKEEVHRTAALARRHRHTMSCAVMDLDFFKSINDTYGHAAGDVVLAKAAAVCATTLRRTDRLGRLGGEEFAVLLPSTGSGGAFEAAEKLRTAIESLRFEFGGAPVRISASFGIASLDPELDDGDALLRHADEALYRAKAAGRNRCEIWHKPEATMKHGRRTLKAGQIVFNGGRSTLDCTVRSLSEDGAGLDVSSTLGVPRKFSLAIKAEGSERPWCSRAPTGTSTSSSPDARVRLSIWRPTWRRQALWAQEAVRKDRGGARCRS